MKKIGILTYHFADNYGAVLQCYALCKAINEFEDCEAQVINYVPSKFKYQSFKGYRQVLFKHKRSMFNTFLNRYCNIEPEMKNTINYEKYDCICVGSDQVWCTIYEDYYLPKVEGVSKISYAASLGYLPESQVLNEDLIRENLPCFDSISIRENIHKKYLCELCGVDCEVVLDPTLLFDKEMYLPLINRIKQKREEFIFLFYLPHDNQYYKAIELANRIAREYNVEIVHSLSDVPENAFARTSKCMIYEGIEDFLYYIKNAKFVITNSYHATLFAIQFEIPFYTLVVESMRSRIDTLVDKLGIESRVLEKGLLEIEIDEEIDWIRLKERMLVEREYSYKYLRRALDIE